MKLLQWLDSFERTPLLNISPIYHKLELVTTRPLTHQFPGRCGGNSSRKKLTAKIECGSLTLKLDMEVWRIVIPEIHPDNDSKESRNDRHGCLFTTKLALLRIP
jgi:hypothetical protein